ncbi:MAG TPA: amino acid ABC transporter permease [Eoetvoesiella sp.]
MTDLSSAQIQAIAVSTMWTIGLSLAAFTGGGILGLTVALGRTSRSWLLRCIASIYVQVIQGTPLLILIMLMYFGLAIAGFELSVFFAASIAIVIYAAAYFGEIWRGGIESVSRTQWEAAECLALSRTQSLWLVILPQALRISTPPTVSFAVQVIKNTSLASVIGVADLTYTGKLINNSTFQPFLIFTMVAAIYFCLCFPLAMWSRKLEAKLNVNNS